MKCKLERELDNLTVLADEAKNAATVARQVVVEAGLASVAARDAAERTRQTMQTARRRLKRLRAALRFKDYEIFYLTGDSTSDNDLISRVKSRLKLFDDELSRMSEDSPTIRDCRERLKYSTKGNPLHYLCCDDFQVDPENVVGSLTTHVTEQRKLVEDYLLELQADRFM